MVWGVREDGLLLPLRLAARLALVLRLRPLLAVALPRLLLLVVLLAVGVLLVVYLAVTEEVDPPLQDVLAPLRALWVEVRPPEELGDDDRRLAEVVGAAAEQTPRPRARLLLDPWARQEQVRPLDVHELEAHAEVDDVLHVHTPERALEWQLQLADVPPPPPQVQHAQLLLLLAA